MNKSNFIFLLGASLAISPVDAKNSNELSEVVSQTIHTTIVPDDNSTQEPSNEKLIIQKLEHIIKLQDHAIEKINEQQTSLEKELSETKKQVAKLPKVLF